MQIDPAAVLAVISDQAQRIAALEHQLAQYQQAAHQQQPTDE